jgi:vancomycin resistance protein VanW
VAQPIPPTDHVPEKLHNLELARRRIGDLLIPPGGVFSFWHLVGPPGPKHGFRAGRSLLGGQLRVDYGGGLCQLSGAIYHLSLLAGLRVLERHPHSVDIYDDSTRHTPLGADATVAYGFKDLRVENTLPEPLCLQCELDAGLPEERRSIQDVLRVLRGGPRPGNEPLAV